jgi:glycosyltransferase involved in cell wall biosynthesis
MKLIKICFVSLYAYHYFNPAVHSQFGGAELQLYNLATELVKDPQFEIYFVVGDFGQSDFEIRDGIKLYKFFNSQKGLKYFRAIFGFHRLWKLLRKINADIYIQRTTGLETGEVALFCKTYDKKFIYMVANNEEVIDTKPSFFQKGIIGFVRWKLFRFGLKIADLIIVQHEEQNKNLKKFYSKKGIVRKSAHKISEQINASWREYVLWVARCDNYKQPELFLDLARKFPEKKFVMIMPLSNDKNYFKKIKNEASKVQNLQFIDYVFFNEIDNYFLRAKVFINTSRTEGFPNTFVQAAKNKTPILSLNINPDGILEKYKIGINASGSFEALKKGLSKLFENQDLWNKMSENAYKYAKENHDIKKIIEEDKKILVEIFKKNR